MKNLDNSKYLTNFNVEGSSNYAFPLIIRKKSKKFSIKLEKTLSKNNIEFRRGGAGGGNQLRQLPYLKKYVKNIQISKFGNVEHMHFFGYYLEIFQHLEKKK